MPLATNNYPFLGFGLGLRAQHYPALLESQPSLDWLEIITENFFALSSQDIFVLDQLRQQYPLVMHGVGLSIGGTDPLNLSYLQQVRQLAARIEPVWISDHLSWTSVGGVYTHELLPLPFTQATVTHVVERIQQVQEFLGQRILIENVSSYLNFKQSTLPEWEFVCDVVKQADCYLLLDINNIYVNSINHGFDAYTYLANIPVSRVAQIHLAGHTSQQNFLIDTHAAPIPPAVWDLYRAALQRYGAISTLIERDGNIPPLDELLLEVQHARALAREVVHPLPQVRGRQTDGQMFSTTSD